ncbi:unnamed protein product [Moneuplotes crassus]|uniref:Transmembrane protein n=1 Tax=Euplotes crassus TaxID=5936 RepID=A0AAD1UI08_EUPCR|nr:unnamed protein product [Moneuplotes crassus]
MATLSLKKIGFSSSPLNIQQIALHPYRKGLLAIYSDQTRISFIELDLDNLGLKTHLTFDCINIAANCLMETLINPKITRGEDARTYYALYEERYYQIFTRLVINRDDHDVSQIVHYRIYYYQGTLKNNLVLTKDNKAIWVIFQDTHSWFDIIKYDTTMHEFRFRKRVAFSQLYNFRITDQRDIYIANVKNNLEVYTFDYDHGAIDIFDSYTLNFDVYPNVPYSLITGLSSNLTTLNIMKSSSVAIYDPNVDLSLNLSRTYVDDFIFIDSEKDFNITSGKLTITPFCPPLSISGIGKLNYDIKQLKPNEALGYTLSVDPETGNLTILSPKNANNDIVQSEFLISTHKQLPTHNYSWTHNIKITATPNKEVFSMLKYLQIGTFVIGILISFLSALLGGSLIQGVWMVFNQQKLLLLILLIDIYFDADIEFLIQQQSFVVMDLDFMNGFLPDFILSPFFIEGFMDKPQSSESLKGIGFETQSAFREYWKLFLGLFILVIVHAIAGTVRKVCQVWKRKRANNKIRAEIELEGGSSEESKGEMDSKNRLNNFNDDIRDLIYRNEESLNRLDTGMVGQYENHIDDSDLQEAHHLNSSNPNSQDLSSLEEDIRPQRIKKGCCLLCCRLSCSWLWSRATGFFKPEIFWFLFIRGMIESFMGVMIVAMSEVKMVVVGGEVELVSVMCSVVLLGVYFGFYCFVWSVCFCEFIMRFDRSQEVCQVQGGEDEENEDQNQDNDQIKEPVFYEELLTHLSKEPFVAFHIPLVLTRIFVFTFLIVIFESFPKGMSWFLFLILLFCQFLYLLQTWMFPKFEWWVLNSIYKINESFLFVFILIFGLMNHENDYEGYLSASLIVLLIFSNTSIVILLQSCGNCIQGFKIYNQIGDYLKQESKPEIKKAVKPKKKRRKVVVFDVATFEVQPEVPPETMTINQETMTDRPINETEIFLEPAINSPFIIMTPEREPYLKAFPDHQSEEVKLEEISKENIESDNFSLSESHKARMSHIGLCTIEEIEDISILPPPDYNDEYYPTMLRRPSSPDYTENFSQSSPPDSNSNSKT